MGNHRTTPIPGSYTIPQLLQLWKETDFTGVAVINVHKGVPHSIEFGRPNRLQLEYSEGQLEKTSLTAKDTPP